jgi:hypothetical protein
MKLDMPMVYSKHKYLLLIKELGHIKQMIKFGLAKYHHPEQKLEYSH